MKTDIIDRIDAVLAENRQVKRQRMQAHVMWLLDNPTQLPIERLAWDETTTAVTEQDLWADEIIAGHLWWFGYPNSHFNHGHLCVRCLEYWTEGDHPWCGVDKCQLFSPELDNEEPWFATADLADLPQPLHRGHVHVQPMVSDR